jgi:2-keto-3-deoxy-galactonokinase
MRGEETQVLGVLQTLPDEAGGDLLIGLPAAIPNGWKWSTAASPISTPS